MISITSNGPFTPAQPIAALFERLERTPLDPQFEAFGNFVSPAHGCTVGGTYGKTEYADTGPIHADSPNAMRFFGNFFCESAVFNLDTDEPDLIKRLTVAIRANQASAAYADAVVSASALAGTTRYLIEATSAQWAVMQQVKAGVPDAQVFLRERVLSWTADPKAPRLRIVTVLGFMKLGPLTLRREFCIPETCSAMPESDGGPEI